MWWRVTGSLTELVCSWFCGLWSCEFSCSFRQDVRVRSGSPCGRPTQSSCRVHAWHQEWNRSLNVIQQRGGHPSRPNHTTGTSLSRACTAHSLSRAWSCSQALQFHARRPSPISRQESGHGNPRPWKVRERSRRLAISTCLALEV